MKKMLKTLKVAHVLILSHNIVKIWPVKKLPLVPAQRYDTRVIRPVKRLPQRHDTLVTRPLKKLPLVPAQRHDTLVTRPRHNTLLTKKAASKAQYLANSASKKAASKAQYLINSVAKKSTSRRYYQHNKDSTCAHKRDRYALVEPKSDVKDTFVKEVEKCMLSNKKAKAQLIKAFKKTKQT